MFFPRNTLNEDTMHGIHPSGRFLIVVTKLYESEENTLNEGFVVLWRNGLVNSHILIENEANIWTLNTFLPYENDCVRLTRVKIESFTAYNCSELMTLPIHKLYSKKLTNFKGCPLYSTTNIVVPYVIPKSTSHDTQQFEGIEGVIVNQISESLNFTLVHSYEIQESRKRMKNASKTLKNPELAKVFK